MREKLARLSGGRKVDTAADKIAWRLRVLEGHALKVEQGEGVARSWLCRNPKGGNAWFRVVAAPDMMAIYGDVADRIVYRIGTGDIIPWVRGAVHSRGYFVSKMPGAKREFDPDSVEEVMIEILQDHRENRDFVKARLCVERIRECRGWRDIHSTEHALEAIEDLEEDAWERGGSFERPTDDVIWFVAAAQKFIELLDEKVE